MGQIGGDLMNRNVTDPRQAQWGDLDPNEKTARIASGALRGLGQGYQNMQQPRMGGGSPGQFSMPSYNGPLYSTSNLPGSIGKNPIFYGGS